MTEIKSAIDHYRDVCVQMGQYPESDTYRYAELAIRSLQAWEEVLTELSDMKKEIQEVSRENWDCKYDRFTINAIIGIINQHLAEIEEVR